jgi:magnesium chelatase family protein
MPTRNPAASVAAIAYDGAATRTVRVRASVIAGQGRLSISGLPPDSLTWTIDRLYAGIVNAGLDWPTAAVRLEVVPPLTTPDSGVDAALAVALLAGTGQIPADRLGETVFLGELGLDGRLRTPRVIYERLSAAVDAGFRLAVVPAGSLALAAGVDGITVWPAHHLRELADALSATASAPARWPSPGVPVGDLSDVPPQHGLARRALELAAAGGHHLAMIGPPTAGTSMLAHRLPGLLPDLDAGTGASAAELYRMVGLLPPHVRMLRRPPWQAPHHSTFLTALIGTLRQPGAVSLAHGGVLFLDEAAAFAPRTIQALHQPLDAGRIVLTGAGRRVRYPARVQLVLASRACPCLDPDACTCTPVRRRRYLARLNPLLDRVAIQVSLPPLQLPAVAGQSTATVAARVAQARAAAAARWQTQRVTCNHEVPTEAVQASMTRQRRTTLSPLAAAVDAGVVTARGAAHIVRLGWTIADIDGRDQPSRDDLTEAVALHTGR